MSDTHEDSRIANHGYKKDPFERYDSDDEEEFKPKADLRTIVSRVEQLTVKTGEEEEGVVPKAPPMYRTTSEERQPAATLHQMRPGQTSNRRARPETIIAIRNKLRKPPSSPSTTDDSHSISMEPARDFWPRQQTPEMVNQWDRISKIDEENYVSRWNQDTELIRLVRRGDVQGLESYQQLLGNSYRCMIEINTINACFLSPLAIALYQGNQRAIRILLTMGARPDVRLSFGNNCFHLVAENDNQGVTLHCLLETCLEMFSTEEFDKMLNTPNMFSANPLDILYQRMSQHKPGQHQLASMINMMESHGARRRAGILPDNHWFGPSTM